MPKLRELALELKHTTIAEALRQAGYATYHIGKWHLGGYSGQDSEMNAYLPEHQGFDHAVYVPGGAPISYYFSYGTRGGDGDGKKQWKSFLPEQRRKGLYLTDRIAEEAITAIQRAKGGPFFLYVPFHSPHTPIEGRPDLVAKYERLPKGQYHRNPQYAAMIEALDTAVGRIRNEIAAAGIVDRTLDNGGYGRGITSNEPLRGEKGPTMEGW